ncbi:YigZ family protein [Oribacterium sp. oral taxon 102]|uniref:YigZ family protein n=1 Tax=Oribacterium sp. oral taxon 102 TaxID=671214 RepID=UPI0015C16637|nr:YigZ family protein [Oribacterium sp. oral taxon 102]NWO21968.1 YigZ family protein [Oribacterium sp. oral taxon 102]
MKYVREKSTGEYEEKKSRFFAELFPISSETEAEERLASVRKRYYDARHHCYAYVLGRNCETQKQSDDGEPSQTAGLPILGVLKGEELRDALLVVTRYFGGTLLGTGGLVRAYTAAAKEAVRNAVLMEAVCGYRGTAEFDYTLLGRLRYLTERLSIREESTDYTDKVRVSWLIPEEALPSFEKQLEELGHGGISLEIERTQWYTL